MGAGGRINPAHFHCVSLGDPCSSEGHTEEVGAWVRRLRLRTGRCWPHPCARDLGTSKALPADSGEAVGCSSPKQGCSRCRLLGRVSVCGARGPWRIRGEEKGPGRRTGGREEGGREVTGTEERVLAAVQATKRWRRAPGRRPPPAFEGLSAGSAWCVTPSKACRRACTAHTPHACQGLAVRPSALINLKSHGSLPVTRPRRVLLEGPWGVCPGGRVLGATAQPQLCNQAQR